MCVPLVDIMDAQGGLDRWCDVRSIDVGLNFSGALLDLKGFPGHHRPVVTVDTHYCYDPVMFDRLVIPTLRRVVRRTPDGPLISGRTSFILDYVDVVVRQ